jgi:type III secretory pathway component EscU
MRPKKDKFEDLTPEFKDSVQVAKSEEIRSKLANLSLAQVSLKEAKSNDEKLKEAVEVKKELEAPYRDSLKQLRLQTEFLHFTLQDRGEDVQAFE